MKKRISIEVVTITRDMALDLLKSNKLNRKLRREVVQRYANDMLNGKWTECATTISFYSDGTLADGQHRLHAIVLSGIEQEFIVRHGLTREAGLNIDTGFARTLPDASQIMGSDFKITERFLAVSRVVETGQRIQSRLSHSERLETAVKHREATEWAIKHFKKSPGVKNAITMAAVARAWGHEADHEKLARYCDVLATGFADGPQESAAVAIRNHFLTKGTGIVHTARFRENFLKTQNSIWYFMRSKPLTVVRSIAEEMYPLKQAFALTESTGE